MTVVRVEFDRVLAAHVERIILGCAHAHDIYLSDFFSRAKPRPHCEARLSAMKALEKTVERCDIYGRGFMYRILDRESGAVTWEQDGAPPAAKWKPLSTTRIGHLLGLDHSTVVHALNRDLARELEAETTRKDATDAPTCARS